MVLGRWEGLPAWVSSATMAAGDEARLNRGMFPLMASTPVSACQVWEEAIVVDDAVPEPPGKDRAGCPPAASVTRGRA